MRKLKLSAFFTMALLGLSSCAVLQNHKKHPEKASKFKKNDIVTHFLNKGSDLGLFRTEQEMGWTNDLIATVVDMMDSGDDGDKVIISSKSEDDFERKAHGMVATYMKENVAFVVSDSATADFEFIRHDKGKTGGILVISSAVLDQVAAQNTLEFMEKRGRPYLRAKLRSGKARSGKRGQDEQNAKPFNEERALTLESKN